MWEMENRKGEQNSERNGKEEGQKKKQEGRATQ